MFLQVIIRLCPLTIISSFAILTPIALRVILRALLWLITNRYWLAALVVLKVMYSFSFLDLTSFFICSSAPMFVPLFYILNCGGITSTFFVLLSPFFFLYSLRNWLKNAKPTNATIPVPIAYVIIVCIKFIFFFSSFV